MATYMYKHMNMVLYLVAKLIITKGTVASGVGCPAMFKILHNNIRS